MKLVDSNVWISLAIPGHIHYAPTLKWFSEQEGIGELLFCRAVQQSFLRLLTTRSILNAVGSPPLTNEQAWRLYNGLAGDQRVTFVQEPLSLEPTWLQFSNMTSSSPKLWMDAYLAAFAMAGGYQLVTLDRDFKQFPGLDLLVIA